VAPKIPADSLSEYFTAFRSAPARGRERPPGSWRDLQGLWLLRLRDLSHGALSPAIVRVVDRWPSPRAHHGLVLLRLKWHGPARGFPSGCAWGRVTYGLTLVIFASPSEMLSGTRGPLPSLFVRFGAGHPKAPCSSSLDPFGIGTPLIGLSMFAPPSTCLPSVHSRSCPGSGEPSVIPLSEDVGAREIVHALRLEDATLRTRSALAVSLDFGGFLRWTGCRFVAPCCRPWGSPCFRPSSSRLSTPPARRGAARPVTCTSEEVPSASVLRHRRLTLPKRCALSVPRGDGLSRICDHSQWRFTLRSFPLTDSRATSPWSLPSRHQVRSPRPSPCHLPGDVVRIGSVPRPLTSGPCSIDESVAPS
jgi:hypothetical protein